MGTGDSKLSSNVESSDRDPKNANFDEDSQEINDLNCVRIFDDEK